jgi:excisionase family DNA binding protein
MQIATSEHELLTIPEAADLLRVGRSTVYAMIGAGQLPRLKIRKAVRVRRDDVERIAREGTAAE